MKRRRGVCRCVLFWGLPLAFLVVVVLAMSFFSRNDVEPWPAGASSSPPAVGETEPAHFREARARMVQDDLASRDITDPRVLEAMGRVPRQEFMPARFARDAYRDGPLPIGHGQTISQPYIVALMTQLVQPKPESKALDIGTGSGYQAAILAELCDHVYCIEIVEPLAESARKRLAALGYKNVTVRQGDGYQGWKEHAPFDAIIVTAAPDHLPQPLADQLAEGGRMVIPIGPTGSYQTLWKFTRAADGTLTAQNMGGVIFVPFTGEGIQSDR